MNEETSAKPRAVQAGWDRVDAVIAYLHRFDPRRDTSAKEVAMRLRRAAHYVEIQIRRELAPAGIEVWEMELLATLLRRGGTLPVSVLQDTAQLTGGAITNRISRLEKDGYVARAIDTKDRRQILVTLTDSGRQRAAEVIKANDAAQRSVLDKIDPAILRTLADDLRILLLAIEGTAPDYEAGQGDTYESPDVV